MSGSCGRWARRARIAALPAAAAVLGLLPGHPAPAGAAASITLTGPAAGYVDVTLRSSVQLDNRTFARATGGGDFAGFEIRRLPDLAVVAGSVRVPALPGGGLMYGSPAPTLRPGRYRVSVVGARGEVAVTLPLLRGAPARWRAVAPGRVRGRLVDLAVLRPAPVGRARIPVDTAATSLVGLAIDERYSVGAARAWDRICVAPRGAGCTDDDPGARGEGSNVSGMGGYHVVYPGRLPAGSYDAVFEATGLGLADRQIAFLLVSP